ncbi:glycosyltransferase family 4 protein [Phytohabitans sp. ZYX-F-186]|uniref:Glycosyltransferase family 4 protein n=1 Tax=Phytohabitans maris TaxID=3071409 RepID=A0ABU0ZNN8_9ACTN|nr:glycosyltransferase family 4 protein [Phytohabitans sp. ZYX-F-186]MDQ7908655.1 glycosyltransferase family 4 protein [Phytohabitans sp. ZYX-F-186]
MKVLAVTNLWPTEGSFRGVFVAEQVEGLRKLGHDVDVEVVAQSRGVKDYLLAAPRVRRRARAARYDLVHVHYGLTALSARLVGRVPRVLSLYGSDVNEPWQARITRLTAGHPAVRVYPSKRLVEAAGDPAGVVVPNGIDFDFFAPGDRAAARSRLGFGPDEVVVLFGAAPDNAVKRYDIFTAVLAGLRERGLPVRELILPGPGQVRADVVPKFAAADLLLVTSRQGTESGPLIVKEAAAMGLPVVSVDVGDVREVLDDVTPSAVVDFPPSDPELVEALVAASARVLESGSRSDGRAKIARYDQDAVVRQLAAVYERALTL